MLSSTYGEINRICFQRMKKRKNKVVWGFLNRENKLKNYMIIHEDLVYILVESS